MTVTPEPYTGAIFTLRYDECQTRITGWGFSDAWDWVFDATRPWLAKYPRYAAMKTETVARFELRNMYKEISAETPDQWMFLCKQAIVESAAKWEAVLEMMTRTGFDVSDPNKSSQVIDYGHTVDESVQDTPYGQLSAASDYVSGRSNVTHGGKDTITNRDKLDAEIIMDLRDRWEDNMNKIVAGFDDLFIRIVGTEVEL